MTQLAQFAQYYIQYKHDAGCYDWEQRQQHLASLFDADDSITFSLGKGKEQKIYKHKVYHLNCANNIIVMRFANNIDIPVEIDFNPALAKDEPSCFVIIDNRDNLRTVAIQKRKKAFGSPNLVAKIIAMVVHERLYKEHCYSFDLLPEYYPEDLYKAWEKLQQHTSALRFGVPDMTEEEIRAKVAELKTKQRDYQVDDSLMEPLIRLAVEAKKAKYKHLYTVMPEDKKTALWVDKSSTFIRNLVTMSDALDQPVELFTNDGGMFRCFVDSNDDNTDKIACRDFNTFYLETLFKTHYKNGNRIEPEDRLAAEEQVLKMMNSMKHEAVIEEELAA